MIRTAVVDTNTNKVVNVQMVNPEDKAPKGCILVQTEEANIGDTWDGVKLSRVSDQTKVPSFVIAKGGSKVANVLAAHGITIDELKQALR